MCSANRRVSRGTVRPRYVFSRLVVCGECGRSMRATTRLPHQLLRLPPGPRQWRESIWDRRPTRVRKRPFNPVVVSANDSGVRWNWSFMIWWT